MNIAYISLLMNKVNKDAIIVQITAMKRPWENGAIAAFSLVGFSSIPNIQKIMKRISINSVANNKT